MAIADYDTLKAEVQSWCARHDSTFSASFPTFLGFAEDRLYDGADGPDVQPELRSSALRSLVLEVSEAVPIESGMAYPQEGVLDVRRVSVANQAFGLTALPPDRFSSLKASGVTGNVPMYWMKHGAALEVFPAVTGTLILDIYKRHPAISASNATGPTLTAHGNLYLSACLFEAFSWMQEIELALGHLARLRAGIAGANRASMGLRHAGKLAIRQRVGMP